MNTDTLPGLKFVVSPDRTKLRIYADEPMREYLRDLGEEIHTDSCMYGVFEGFLCNSEYTWIRPEETGDLTDAPILGLLGEEQWEDAGIPSDCYGLRECGSDGKRRLVEPVLERWGFMSYETVSLLEHLRDHGVATLVDRH